MTADPLLEERSFLRVIETGSATAAARDLGADVSTVSRRLGRLERRLGVKLIDRGSRASTPTEIGLRYYEALRRVVDELDSLEADVRGDAQKPRGLLRIAAPTNLGERHVARWANIFATQHPSVTIDLILADQAVDLRGAGVDVAIRIGSLPDSGLVARRLGAMELALFAAPAYLDRCGRPGTPGDLSGHDFVLFSLLQVGDTLPLDGPQGQHVDIRMRSRCAVDTVGAIAEVVMASGGIHAGPLWLFDDLCRRGAVDEVLPGWRPPLYPVHALHSYGRRPPAKVTAFIAHCVPLLRGLPGIVP